MPNFGNKDILAFWTHYLNAPHWPPAPGLLTASALGRQVMQFDRLPRETWTPEQWRLWAEYLEEEGGKLVQDVRKLRKQLAAMPRKRRPGPRPRYPTSTLLTQKRHGRGRPINLTARAELETLSDEMRHRQALCSTSLEAELRDYLREASPKRNQAWVTHEARTLARKISALRQRKL